MRSVCALVSLAGTASGGCFTTWAVTQASGHQRIWDEHVQEAAVPRPGVEETLTITLPLQPEPEPTSVRTEGDRVRPFALGCTSQQRATDDVFHSAFRYGSTWKKGTAVFFLAEGLAATALLLTQDGNPGNAVAGGFFALDALGTAALLFAPRKEIYRKDERPVTTAVRSDCPDGLALELGGNSFAVDAAGRLDGAGDTALDDWMTAPNGGLVINFAGQTVAVAIGAAELCAWTRAHHPDRGAGCANGLPMLPRTATASLIVPVGTLTRVAAD